MEKDFHINDTYRFLYPILRKYGKEYCDCMNSLYKQGVFIHDTGGIADCEDNLFVCVNIPMTEKKIGDTLYKIEVLAEQEYVKQIYIINVNKEDKTPERIMFMIRIPDEYQGIIGKFLDGDMNIYSKADIDKYFQAQNPANADYFKWCRNVLAANTIQQPKLKNEIFNF